jgi:hypothetical protein
MPGILLVRVIIPVPSSSENVVLRSILVIVSGDLAGERRTVEGNRQTTARDMHPPDPLTAPSHISFYTRRISKFLLPLIPTTNSKTASLHTTQPVLPSSHRIRDSIQPPWAQQCSSTCLQHGTSTKPLYVLAPISPIPFPPPPHTHLLTNSQANEDKLSEESRIVCVRFGNEAEPACMGNGREAVQDRRRSQGLGCHLRGG